MVLIWTELTGERSRWTAIKGVPFRGIINFLQSTRILSFCYSNNRLQCALHTARVYLSLSDMSIKSLSLRDNWRTMHHDDDDDDGEDTATGQVYSMTACLAMMRLVPWNRSQTYRQTSPTAPDHSISSAKCSLLHGIAPGVIVVLGSKLEHHRFTISVVFFYIKYSAFSFNKLNNDRRKLSILPSTDV